MSGAQHAAAPGLKVYRRPMSFWWWLQRRAYFNFIVRELTCLFVGAFAVLTLLQARAIGQGPEAYAAFAARLSTPAWLVFGALAFVFVLYHALTWFSLVPSTVVLRMGEQRVPGGLIAGAHYAGWLVVSAVVAFILLQA